MFAVLFSGGGLGSMLITVVVVAACVALVYVALKQFGIKVPDFVTQVFWILVVAVVVIAAIRFVLTL